MVHPKVKPGSKANYRQRLSFCPNDPAKSILIPAAEQLGPLSFEGSRSVTARVSGPVKLDLVYKTGPNTGSVACDGYPEGIGDFCQSRLV